MNPSITWTKLFISQAIIVIVVFSGIWFALPYHTHAPRIAYVDTGRMMEGFNEAKRNRAEIDSLNKDWQSKAKALKDSIDQYSARIGATYNKSSVKVQAEFRYELERRNQELAQYAKASQDKVRNREKQLLEPTVKKVNGLLQEYSDQKGFDIIFGSTQMGNILAGGRRLDITGQVTEELNRKYP